jgi:hypothetical protein
LRAGLKNLQATRQNHVDGDVAVSLLEKHFARFNVPQLAMRAEPLNLRRREERKCFRTGFDGDAS